MVQGAIESVLAQNHVRVELVLVDDGSSDQTVLTVQKKYPLVKIICTGGVGPGAARNAGVDASSCEVVMFLDSDDLWEKEHARELLTVLDKGYHVAYGTTETIDQTSGTRFLIPDKGQGPSGNCFEHLVNWCFLVPSSVAVRRDAFYAVNGFSDLGPGELGEDWDFFLRLSKKYYFGFAGEKVLSQRQLHRGSMCYLTDNKKILRLLERLKSIVAHEKENTPHSYNRFVILEQFVKNKGKQWKTVQDWYSAMKTEGLV